MAPGAPLVVSGLAAGALVFGGFLLLEQLNFDTDTKTAESKDPPGGPSEDSSDAPKRDPDPKGGPKHETGPTIPPAPNEDKRESDRVAFYTVQSPEDALRLATGGAPWPTAPHRAHFGPGLYAWDNPLSAAVYLGKLQPRSETPLSIVTVTIDRATLSTFNKKDLRGSDDAEAFVDRHSHLFGQGEPHPYDWIIRPVDKSLGHENYFTDEVFPNFRVGF